VGSAAPWTWASSGGGQGDAGSPRSAAAKRGPGPASGDQSEAGRRTLQRGATFRSDARPRGPARPHYVSRVHSFDSMATCEAHRRRERHWHANWYDPELKSVIAGSSPPRSAMPRRVRSGPSSRRTRGVGTAGTTAAREQLNLPFTGPRRENTRSTSAAVDSDRASFLPYGPLVSDWLAFLAERLTAEFLRDVARGPRA
jgi:hypothetical protein